MTAIEHIKLAIAHLPREELRELRAWYEQFDAALWEEQLKADVAAGRLDRLAEEAVQAH